jgi:hypothetical protein
VIVSPHTGRVQWVAFSIGRLGAGENRFAGWSCQPIDRLLQRCAGERLSLSRCWSETRAPQQTMRLVERDRRNGRMDRRRGRRAGRGVCGRSWRGGGGRRGRRRDQTSGRSWCDHPSATWMRGAGTVWPGERMVNALAALGLLVLVLYTLRRALAMLVLQLLLRGASAVLVGGVRPRDRPRAHRARVGCWRIIWRYLDCSTEMLLYSPRFSTDVLRDVTSLRASAGECRCWIAWFRAPIWSVCQRSASSVLLEDIVRSMRSCLSQGRLLPTV